MWAYTECLNLTLFRTFFIVVSITPQVRQIFVAKTLTNLLRSPFESVFFGRCWFSSCKRDIGLIDFGGYFEGMVLKTHGHCCCIPVILSLLIDFIPTLLKRFNVKYIFDICGYAVHNKILQQFSAFFTGEQTLLLLRRKEAVGVLTKFS